MRLNTIWIDAEKATKADFAGVDGIVVPGGFGIRGIEGKIAAANYCLEHNKPYLGLCLGLQTAVIAAARRGGVKSANSEEFDAPKDANVVYIMEGLSRNDSGDPFFFDRRNVAYDSRCCLRNRCKRSSPAGSAHDLYRTPVCSARLLERYGVDPSRSLFHWFPA